MSESLKRAMSDVMMMTFTCLSFSICGPYLRQRNWTKSTCTRSAWRGRAARCWAPPSWSFHPNPSHQASQPPAPAWPRWSFCLRPEGTIWHGHSQGFEACVGRPAVAPRLGKCYATSVLQAVCSITLLDAEAASAAAVAVAAAKSKVRCPWPCPRVAAKAQPYLVYLAELQ